MFLYIYIVDHQLSQQNGLHFFGGLNHWDFDAMLNPRLFCTQKKPVIKKLQQFGQFSAGHFSIIVKIAVGLVLAYFLMVQSSNLTSKRFRNASIYHDVLQYFSRMLLFHLSILFSGVTTGFTDVPSCFWGRKYPMVGPIQAHLSWVGRAPHSLGRMAGAGRC